ncbi:histidine phosphatase family protein [Paenibacillus sp. Marseille-Q4541]|uniref:histidine phosphatase family protein n=1 Tax=Paenibacillus sp. Marseille-Q4541 TaxID=2831522 RepID=UPI001BAA8E73|nr:histidine phosphatase family protein [Paenibacillus sp. Marseille-Q4541]
MRIGLIRHGLTDWNVAGRIQGRSDIPLNEEGRRQAKLLGERLLTEPYQWDYIITSGLSRAQETGEIISGIIHVPLLPPDERLQERSFGQAEGLTQEEREAKWGVDWNSLDLGQEKEPEMRLRALAFINDLAQQYPHHHILVVSHGALLAQLYRALYEDRYTERIGNLSLTILENEEENWNPLLYNCTKHLLESISDKTNS